RYRVSTVRMLASFFNGVIGRAVVDDNYFQRHTALVEDAFQASINEATRIECRHDNAQRWSVRAILIGRSSGRCPSRSEFRFALTPEFFESFDSAMPQMPQGFTPLLSAHMASPPFLFTC